MKINVTKWNSFIFAASQVQRTSARQQSMASVGPSILSWGRPSGRPFSAFWVLFLGLMSLPVQMKQRLTLTLELTLTVLELHQPRRKLAISSSSFHSLRHNHTPDVPHRCVSTTHSRQDVPSSTDDSQQRQPNAILEGQMWLKSNYKQLLVCHVWGNPLFVSLKRSKALIRNSNLLQDQCGPF